MATSPLSITPEALKSLYADLTSQGYSHDVLVNAARQNYGIDLDQALKSSAPISYTDKINSGPLETAAQPTYAEYQASLPAATSGALVNVAAPKTAYDYATAPGGIGLGAMNQNIQNFFSANPTEEAARAAMAEYGVSDADIKRATGRSLADYYPTSDNMGAPAGGVTGVSPLGSLASGVATAPASNALSAATDTTNRFYDPKLKQEWVIESASDYGYGANRFAGSDGKVYINPVTGQALSRDEYLSTAGTPEALTFQQEQANRITLANQINTLTDSGKTGGTWDKNQGYALHQQNITDYLVDQGVSDLSNVTWKRNADNTVTLFDKVTNKELGTADINSPYIEIGREGTGKGKTHYFMVPTREGGVTFASQWEPVSDPTLKTIAKAGPIVNIANFLTGGALTPFAMAVNAINAAENRDALGFVTNMAGAAGLNDIAMAGRVAQMAKSGNVLGALATVAGSEFGNQLGGVDLGGGFTVSDAVNAVSAIDLASKGDYAGALTMAGKAAGSADLQTAGSALAFAKAVESGDLNRIASAGMQFKNNLSTSINNSQVANLLINSAGIGAIDADAGTAATGVIRTDPLITAGQESLDAKVYSAVKATGASDAVAAQAVKLATATGRDTQYDPDLIDATRGQALANLISQAQEAIRMGAGEAVGTGEIRAGAGEFAGAGASRAVSDEISNAPNFSAAYAAARAAFGPNSTFNYQGKLYSTATFQEDPKLGLVPVAGSGRGAAAGKTAEQEAAYENTRQQLAAAAAKPTSLVSSIGNWLSNQMQLSSEAAQNYLKNNPNSPITQSVSTAYDAAGELLSNVAGGTALLLNNKPLADEFIRGGGELQKFGQSIGTGPQDTANFNDTMQLLSAAQGPQEKLAVLAGRILDGTSGLARQTVIELRQELPALFLGGAGARAAMVASGLIDAADTAGNAAIGAYDDAVRSGKTHDQALLDARKAGAAAGATEAAIQLTIGKLGDFAIGKLDNVAGKATSKVLGEGVTEGGQEAGASAAVDLALGQSVDVNKALTQGIIGSAIGKSTALSTTPVDVATSDTASTFNNTLAQTGDIVQASTGSVTTAINNGLAPGTAVSTVIDAAAKSGGDMSAVITASIDTGLSTALSSGADASTAVSTIVAGSVTASLNNGVDASMAVSATVGSSVTAGIASGADASTVIASSVTAAVSTATQSGANATAVVVGSTNTAVSTAIANGVDAGTAISSAVDSATQAGANASTATASSITAAVAAGADVNTAIAAATNANSNITANSTTNNNVTSTVATDASTGVTSQTVVDSTSNTSTTTTTNNNVTSQVTTVGSTTTTTTSDVSTGVTTQTTVDGTRSTDVTVDTNTSITTQVVTDTNTNTKVTVAWSPDGDTKVTYTDPEGKETVFEDLDVGDPPKIDIVAPLEPVKAEVSPPKEPVKETKPKTSQSGSGSAMMLPAMAGVAAAVDWLGPQFLKSKERNTYLDPLAEFQALQQATEQQDLLKQIQPESANVLTERGAMPYYAYGQEPSIDEVLGLPDEESSSYNESDYVPVFKSGGKVSPLNIQMMYAKGGHTREDFRDGKHVAGPGDGQSDDIPAWLADGEFVFPADVVSALGNGSTKAGTEKLYEMMHKIRDRARSKHPKDLPPPAHKSPLDYLKKGK